MASRNRVSWIQRVRHRLQPVWGHIDQTWSHDGCVGVRGWLVHKKGELQHAEIEADGVRVPITNWHPRPDVQKILPDLDQSILNRCGFWAHIPRLARHRITLMGSDGDTSGSLSWQLDAVERPAETKQALRARELFGVFIEEVNAKNLSVLEVGSRVVAPGSKSKRSLFHAASSYTGFDYYPDDNTDIVGDAHRLADHFKDRKFDAVFSYSVLEHLALPWVFAIEINRVLERGGLTFHHTHFAWPQHEQPWDFWRFTDEGLKVLFSKATGFEVLESGMFEPVHMYMDRVANGMESFPEFPAYGGSVVLARKVADCPAGHGIWDTDVGELTGGAVYPPVDK